MEKTIRYSVFALKGKTVARVKMITSTYADYNFEVIYKVGTDQSSRFFFSADEAIEFFEEKEKELKATK